MKIGIVGGGVVGRVTARCWLEHCDEVRVYDKIKERRTHSIHEILVCDLVFVCLPENVLEQWAEDLLHPGHDYRNVNLVLKSTVPIGTTRRLAEKYRLPNLVHSPEFLTARCALTDVQVPSRNIVGVPFPKQGKSEQAKLMWSGDNQASQLLNVLYHQRFPGIPVLLMSSDESEAVKLMTNAFFATKVAFFNEMYQLAERLGLDWETVREGMLSDGRIAHSHTQVPGRDGFGFGGRCLPKDLDMLIDQIEACNPDDEHSYSSSVTRGACSRNTFIDQLRNL